MHRIWNAILVHVLGQPGAGPNDEGTTCPRLGVADGVEGREDRFEPYIRARIAWDSQAAVYDVTLEGVDKQFRCKADAVSYCSGRMVRLGLKP